MDGDDQILSPGSYKSYALSGKIMLTAIIVLFSIIILMVCLHLYVRWYLYRTHRRNLRRVLRRTHLVFYLDTENATRPGSSFILPSRGLDPSVLESLPVFVYSKTHPDPIDCAVCLSEFEENETGRILPKCGHSFHIECIDMWFCSHYTCPLCRSPVEPAGEVVLSVAELERSEPGSSSGLNENGEGGGEDRMKPLELMGVSIEVPRRNKSFGRVEDELRYNSPISRVMSLSFKRILSRDRRGGGSTSGNGASCSSLTE